MVGHFNQVVLYLKIYKLNKMQQVFKPIYLFFEHVYLRNFLNVNCYGMESFIDEQAD